mgnify:CR=1 FL=1
MNAMLLWMTMVFAADLNVPQAASDEVLRRGSSVEMVGIITEDDILVALGPPADDSHKWFLTVITRPGCSACALLKAEWSIKPELLAFARPGDPENSWSHYNVYRSDDPTQSFRWQGIQITEYPTVLVQPPRNGQYGDPATVVMQRSGYAGGAPSLAGAIRSAVLAYATRQPRAARSVQVVSADVGIAADAVQPEVVSAAPPFVVPGVEPVVQPPFVPPLAPAPQVPEPPSVPQGDSLAVLLSLLFSLLGSLFGTGMLTNVLLVTIMLLSAIRTFRKATNQKLWLSDEDFEKLLAALKAAAGKPPTAPRQGL